MCATVNQIQNWLFLIIFKPSLFHKSKSDKIWLLVVFAAWVSKYSVQMKVSIHIKEFLCKCTFKQCKILMITIRKKLGCICILVEFDSGGIFIPCNLNKGRQVNISEVHISHFEKWEKLTLLKLTDYFAVNISHFGFLWKGEKLTKNINSVQ